MFNLLTIHTGRNNDFYGVEVATFYTDTDGYGFLVILYIIEKKRFTYDFCWMSVVLNLIKKLDKWF
jgi:hypothetical protein